MIMTKEKWMKLAKTALLYGILSPIAFYIFDYFFSDISEWYIYLFQGAVFGILMAILTKFLGHKN